MNNLSDSSSPLDAFALNYASFGVFTFVNNYWTWLAVITAAISFWRIRTTSISDKPDQQQSLIDRSPSRSPAQSSDYTCFEYPAPPPDDLSVCEVKDVDDLTEGAKFTSYYYAQEVGESDGVDGDGETTVVKERRDDDDDNGISCCGEWWPWWERGTMRARIGDMGMGWFRYHDLTVVNGNVVQLWDECRRKSERISCYSSCCADWSLVN